VGKLAIFDIDGTLVQPATVVQLFDHLRKHKIVSNVQLAKCLVLYLKHRFFYMDIEAAIKLGLQVIEGVEYEKLYLLMDDIFQQHMQYTLVDKVVNKLNEHQQQGDKVVLLTSTNEIIAQIIGEHLNVDAVVAAKAKIVNGLFTTELIKPVPYGEGKIYWSKMIANEFDCELSEAYFYTDSISDLPLLEIIANPVIVNPDRKLKKIARLRNWPFLHKD
jgi:putative phosphoserine phosphatase / 1-acylglycerol-3-phosphate O-acyltransferase